MTFEILEHTAEVGLLVRAPTLAVDWLNELLYLHDRDGMLAAAVDVERSSETFVEASVRGERFDAAKHDQLLEVKAATYHQPEVKRGDDGWTARVYLNIWAQGSPPRSGILVHHDRAEEATRRTGTLP
ncbi:MAG: archease [Armatimonadetes bacterium]|nr:archease [Armatimonadota bacterium]